MQACNGTLYTCNAASHAFTASLYAFTASFHASNGSLHTYSDSSHTSNASLHAYNGSMNTYDGSLHAFTGALHVSNGSLHTYTGPLYACNGSLHAYTVPMHTCNGSLHACNRICTRYDLRWKGFRRLSGRINAVGDRSSGICSCIDGAAKENGGMGSGKKAGAYGNTPPAKRSYFVISGVGVEVGASGVCGAGFSGGLVAAFLDRPRNGCTPNSTSFSLSGP